MFNFKGIYSQPYLYHIQCEELNYEEFKESIDLGLSISFEVLHLILQIGKTALF